MDNLDILTMIEKYSYVYYVYIQSLKHKTIKTKKKKLDSNSVVEWISVVST